MQKSEKCDKRQFAHSVTEETEQAARQNNMKKPYRITRTLSRRKNTNACNPVKNKNGNEEDWAPSA